jgi:hypothetical protein
MHTQRGTDANTEPISMKVSNALPHSCKTQLLYERIQNLYRVPCMCAEINRPPNHNPSSCDTEANMQDITSIQPAASTLSTGNNGQVDR